MYFFQKRQNRLWSPPSFLFPGLSGRGVKSHIHLHLVQSLQVNGTIPLV